MSKMGQYFFELCEQNPEWAEEMERGKIEPDFPAPPASVEPIDLETIPF
jgi:hypothetical protein